MTCSCRANTPGLNWSNVLVRMGGKGTRRTLAALAAPTALTLAMTGMASAATFKEYPIGAYPAHAPRYIKAGPDGNIWFADGGTEGGVGRISPSGEPFAEFGGPGVVEVAFAPDGSPFWAGDKSIGHRYPNGYVTESTKYLANYAAAVAPNGEFWFSTAEAEWSHSSGISPGSTESFSLLRGGRITSIAFDRAGSAWGAFYEGNVVHELTPDYKQVDLPPKSGPARIALGPEGNLFVTMFDADAVDQITPTGQRRRFPLSAGAGPNDIALGPDGALWITEYKANKIARMTAAGEVTGEFAIPTPNSLPIGIAAGPDGAMWFTEAQAAKIGRIVIDASTTTPVGAGGGAGPAAAGRDTTPPSFTKAPSLHPSRFRSSGRAGGRIPKGSALTFTLSEAATLKVQVSAPRPGRKVNGNCTAPGKSNRHKPACRRYVPLGTLSYNAKSGANRFAFSGRVAGHTLKPGSYRLSAIALDAAGNGSSPAKASFTIAP
jgi:streptogramin lyase